jgi:2'-5' RNA ligase/ribosomal protein S18 acetylase RimI-like enzyme
MPRQRLGVALLIPPPVSVELDALRRAVGEDDTDRIASHVTLVPPVNVREEDVDAAVQVLTDAAAGAAPLRLELGPVTSFAPVSPTLHLRVGGDLERLHALRDAVFTPPLSRPLTHEFVPHVTLVEQSDRIEESVRALGGYDVEVVIDRVHLMRESRREDGARMWRPIADARFGSRSAVIGRGGLELEVAVSSLLPPEAQAWRDARWDELDVARFGDVSPPPAPIAVVARRDHRIVATADGEARPTGEAYLGQLIVAADVRNEGIGAHVVAAFASAAADAGSTFLTLRTDADGRARAFYEGLGFTVSYPLPAWRRGRDFVQMRKEL